MLLLLASCTPAIELELSAIPDARTVVALEDDGSFISWTYVLDVSGRESFEMPYPPEQITLVYAPKSPSELGVTTGLQPVSDGTGKTLLELGFDKQRVWRSGTWTEANLTRLTSGVKLRVATATMAVGCVAPRIEKVALTSSAAYAQPITMGSSAIIVTDLGQAYVVDAERHVTRLGVVPAGQGGVRAAGAYAAGQLWLGVGHCLEQFNLVGTTLRGTAVAGMCVTSGFVDLVDTRDGRAFVVHTTDRTSLLRPGVPPALLTEVVSDNVAIAPDGTIISGAARVIVRRAPSGDLVREMPPIVGEYISSVVWVEGRG